jgi:metal-sulfur cluster biosynthetic enzyme
MTTVTREQVIDALQHVFDPEIPVDVWNFGLIYDVAVDGAGAVDIKMTLTSESCPSARQIPEDIKKTVLMIDGAKTCEVTVVWEPRWNATLISPKGREILGLDEE